MQGTFEREWEQRVAAVFRSQVGVVERYSDPGGFERRKSSCIRPLHLPCVLWLCLPIGRRPQPMLLATSLRIPMDTLVGRAADPQCVGCLPCCGICCTQGQPPS